MLKNEKHMGDALLQETYIIDYLTKKKVKNNGIVPQYYVKDSYEPIISQGIIFLTQEKMAKRASLHWPSMVKKEEQANVKFSSKYPDR